MKKYIVLSSLFLLVACNNEELDAKDNTEEAEGTETVSVEEYEKLQEENENLKITVESLRDDIGEVNKENTELKEQIDSITEETDTTEEIDFRKESKEVRAESKETEDVEETKEDNSEEVASKPEELSREEIQEEVESILEEAGRPMKASVSQGVEGNYITLEGAARNGFSDEQIGRSVKQGMTRILIAFQENDVDFEEVRISFYLPTVDAKGNEGQKNMALGVFDKETVDEINPENEYYVAEGIDTIAVEFELDSQFQ